MKHLFFTAALVGGALAAHAQKGSYYIGGQAGFNTSTTSISGGTTTPPDSKVNTYTFSPEIGTFLSNQLQLGVGFTFGGSRVEVPLNNRVFNRKSNRYGGTVYGRYFFGEGNFRPFLGLNVSVLPGNSTSDSTGVSRRYSTMNVGANLNVGFGYGLTSRVTVVGSFGTFGFQHSTSKEDGSNVKITTNDFGLNANTLGNLFNVGVYYTFIKGDNQ
jgi:hypothetical protein